MSALQKILDKPYDTRTPLEQCISDAVTLEDERDGDYTRMEQAADQLAQMQDENVALKAEITLREQATLKALDECALKDARIAELAKELTLIRSGRHLIYGSRRD